jgi:hypothetical protein
MMARAMVGMCRCTAIVRLFGTIKLVWSVIHDRSRRPIAFVMRCERTTEMCRLRTMPGLPKKSAFELVRRTKYHRQREFEFCTYAFYCFKNIRLSFGPGLACRLLIPLRCEILQGLRVEMTRRWVRNKGNVAFPI